MERAPDRARRLGLDALVQHAGRRRVLRHRCGAGFSYPLGTGAGTVGIAVDSFGKWDRDTFRCYTTTVGTNDEQFLDEVPFDVWRDAYMLGAMRSVQTRPVVVAVGP
jgi:hypothetical protein